MMMMTMTRCTYPPRRSIVILSLLSLLSAGCHHLCNAFSSVPRPLVAVAATSTTTASSSTGSITSSIGHRWNAAHQPILSNSIQRRLRPFFTSLQSFTKNNNEEEEEEISSILRPSYPIEPLPLRIGHGFDIHRMVPLSEAGQPIIIGGVVITHENQKWLDVDGKYTTPNSIYETQLGVLAHSDGDVIYHSLVDAIFGALTLPDIGQVFQDTDPRWKGCDSSKFMEYAYKVMQYYNYQIGNIDVTLILERPKVAKFKPQMKENIVKLLHTTEGRVNIKARTHERLDSVGELRGVSCHVVVTLETKKTE